MIVCDHFSHIPRRTITRGASRKRQNIAKKRPGPDPVLYFWNGVWLGWLVDWYAESGLYSDPRHDLAESKLYLIGDFMGWLSRKGIWGGGGWIDSWIDIHFWQLKPLKWSKGKELRQHKKVCKYSHGSSWSMSPNKKWQTIVFSTWTKGGLLIRIRQERLLLSLDWKMSGKKVWKRHFIWRLLLVFLPMDFMFLHYSFTQVSDWIAPLWTSVPLLEALKKLLLNDLWTPTLS